MYLKLLNEYEIESDSSQFALYRLGVSGKESKTPGAPTRTLVGYYASIEALLKCLPDRVLMASGAVGIKEAVAEVKAIADDWNKKTRGLFND